jgi:ribosomal protein S18 acetylase RimI-like enzyme
MTKSRGRHLKVAVATTSDIPSLHGFILEAWKEAGPSAWGWTGATEESIHELASFAYLRRLVSDSKVKILLARDGERIFGFAANRSVEDTTVELAGIVVLGSVTGLGIGTELLRASLEAASADGYREMTVKTETFNERAIGFYEANGFKRIGSSKEDVEGKTIDLVVLKRKVKDDGAWRG